MLWILAAVVLLALALVLIKLSLMQASAAVAEQDEGVDPILERNTSIPTFLNSYLNHMGLNLSPASVWSLVMLVVFALLLCLVALPANTALIAALITLLLVNAALKTAGTRRKQRLLEQLPSFLNQVARRLSAGVSVEHAFTDSVESLEKPLSDSVKRSMQRMALGMDLHQAFEREAKTSDIREFHVVATAMRVNEQYGGSIRSILEDIVDILRLDDLGKRELRAQTGETRISAGVLSVLPIAIAGWLMIQNPAFLNQMWVDSFGRILLILSAVMVVAGIFTLWRMVRSI